MTQLQSALRRVPFQHVTSILFLLLTAILLASGLGEVVRGARLSAFVPVGLTAALVGWGLGSRRGNGWLKWVVMVLGGAGLLWVSTAQLGAPLLRLASSIPTMLYEVARWGWDQKLVPDFSTAASVWFDLVTQSSGLGLRLWFWAQALQGGENRYDPVVYVLGWSFLLWLVAVWAGWFLRRDQVLTAAIPSLLLLAEVIYVTGVNIYPLWLMLSIALVLMGLTHFRLVFASWAQRGVDYAEIILDTTITFILTASVFLAMIAWVVPAFSLQDFLDRIREYSTPEQTGPTLAESLGLQTVPGSGAQSTAPQERATLPELHSIGPGPDLSRDLVMSIRTGEIPAGQISALQPPYHRWRSNTMDRYTGHGWANTSVVKTAYTADAAVFAQIPTGYRILRQTVRTASKTGQRLYWDGILQSVDRPFEAAWRTKPQANPPANVNPFAEADLLGAFSAAESYQVTSLLVLMDTDQLRAASTVYPDSVRRGYLALPDGIPERVFALARQITATAPTSYDQARALEAYLRKTYPYTLNIPAPPANQDVVDYFLFDLKKGFCDYYATAMVVMARSVELPARIVFGYANGAYDPIMGEYNVVRADAHAWVEVYFPKMGWVEFDPTGNQPEVDRLQDDPAYVPDDFAIPLDTSERLMLWWQTYASTVMWWGAIIGVGALLFIWIWQLGEFLLLTRLPMVRAMQIIYRGLYHVGRPFVGRATKGETTVEFDALLYGQIEQLAQKRLLKRLLSPATYQIDLLTRLYLRAIYTPRPPEKTEIRDAVQAWQSLRWRLLLTAIVTIPLRLYNRQSAIANPKS